MTKLGKFAAACAAVLCGFGAEAGEDFSQYAHKAYVTFGGYAGETTLTNFPALVRIAEGVGGFSYADCALAKGGDVRFSLGNGIELPSECVKWDTAGTSEFWVRVPELTASTRIMMFWGNAGANPRPGNLRVWDDTYTGVYEMNDDGYGIFDASRSAIHGTGMTSTSGETGIAGTARKFANTYATIGGINPRPFSQPPMSVEIWYKLEAALGGDRILLALHRDIVNNYRTGLQIRVDKNGKASLVVTGSDDKAAVTLTAKANPTLGEWHHAMATCDAPGSHKLYVDGELQVSADNSVVFLDPSWEMHVILGRCKWQNQNNFTGDMDELRFSSAARSADYAKAVYQNAATDTFLTIEAEPSELTEVTVDSELLEAGDGVRYLADGDDAIHADGVPVESVPGDAKHVVTTHRWKKQYKVSVASDEWGTVTPAGEFWADAGTTVDVAAALKNPDDTAHAFYAWGGNCPTLEVFSASFKLPVDCSRTISAKFGNVFYVKPADAGGSDNNDGLTLATAFATPEKAMETIRADAALEPAVVFMDEGTWKVEIDNRDYLTIDRAVAFKSLKGREKTFIQRVLGKCDHKCAVTLNHMGAYLEGLTVTGGKAEFYDAYLCIGAKKGHVANCFAGNLTPRYRCGAMGIDAGWIRDSIVSGAVATDGGYRIPSLIVHGGLVTDCVISNNTSTGGNILMNSRDYARMRNCLIVGNKNGYAGTSDSFLSGGSIRYEATDGILGERMGVKVVENCTFVNNKSNGKGGGAYATGTGLMIVNCAFAGNAASEGADFSGSIGMVGSVARGANAANGNIAAEAEFEDAANGNYAATLNAPNRDCGVGLDWMYVPGAADFAGSNRVQGVAVDAGAFEMTPPAKEPLSVRVSADVTDGREMLTVVFTPEVKGAVQPTYLWEFGDGGTSTDASVSHTYAKPGYYTVKLTVTDESTGETGVFEKEGLIKVTADTVYVAPKDASTPTAPYASEATAATSIEAVLTLKPKKIVLLAGESKLGYVTVNPDWALEIVGQGPEVSILESSGARIQLTVEGSIVHDLTCRNLMPSDEGFLYLGSGTIVSNCVFRGTGGNLQFGQAVRLAGGTAVECVFRNLSHQYGYFSPAINIAGAGSLVDRCVVTNNTTRNDYGGQDGRGCGIYVIGDYEPTPIVRNSLIAKNTLNDGEGCQGAGLYAAGRVRVENCTIVGNKQTYKGAGAGVYFATDGGELVNTIVWDNVTTNAADNFVVAAGKTATVTASCTDRDPRFNLNWRKNRPYWSIRSGLPCKDTGVRLDWMTDGATDLIGNPRVVGAPDMGCYENQTGGLMLLEFTHFLTSKTHFTPMNKGEGAFS